MHLSGKHKQNSPLQKKLYFLTNNEIFDVLTDLEYRTQNRQLNFTVSKKTTYV